MSKNGDLEKHTSKAGLVIQYYNSGASICIYLPLYLTHNTHSRTNEASLYTNIVNQIKALYIAL